jgi:hypothetical protein
MPAAADAIEAGPPAAQSPPPRSPAPPDHQKEKEQQQQRHDNVSETLSSFSSGAWLSLATVAVLAVVFYMHKIVQYFYYRECKSNLLRVLFFDQAPMCTYMAKFLNVLEGTFADVGYAAFRTGAAPFLLSLVAGK